MTVPPDDSLVVFLHGVGARGGDLAPLAAPMRSLLPRTRFAAPDAPEPFDRGPGWQWFSVTGVSEADRPRRIAAARAQFDRIVTAQLEQFGFLGQPDRVALVGFSQGAIMALDAIASGRLRFAAVVAFSGRLASPEPLAPAPGARALLLHGEADPVIPAAETRRAAARLRELGVAADARVFAGLGHAISPEEVAIAAAFLAESFACR